MTDGGREGQSGGYIRGLHALDDSHPRTNYIPIRLVVFNMFNKESALKIKSVLKSRKFIGFLSHNKPCPFYNQLLC